MRIVIVHFHLQTGGVTRVIQHAARSLADQGHEVLLLSGEPTEQAFPARTRLSVLPCLAYEERRHGLSPREVAAALQRAARDCFGDLPTCGTSTITVSARTWVSPGPCWNWRAPGSACCCRSTT